MFAPSQRISASSRNSINALPSTSRGTGRIIPDGESSGADVRTSVLVAMRAPVFWCGGAVPLTLQTFAPVTCVRRRGRTPGVAICSANSRTDSEGSSALKKLSKSTIIADTSAKQIGHAASLTS